MRVRSSSCVFLGWAGFLKVKGWVVRYGFWGNDDVHFGAGGYAIWSIAFRKGGMFNNIEMFMFFLWNQSKNFCKPQESGGSHGHRPIQKPTQLIMIVKLCQ